MKLININIEGEKHFDTVLPFLEKERPDVLCLQEVYKKDLHHFESRNFQTTFLPITLKVLQEHSEELGIALMVNTASGVIEKTESHYYHDPSGELHDFDNEHKDLTVNNGVLIGTLSVTGESYTIATTHFTWIPDGNIPNDYQRDDMVRFLEYMKTVAPHCLTGDLNIPRHHNPLYEELRKHYSDAIPDSYTSSLDKNKHRLGTEADKNTLFTDFMVDHLLIQEPYRATDVRLEFGISDHAAIVATILKN